MNVKAWVKRTNDRINVEKLKPLFTEKTMEVLEAFYKCLEKGCIDRIPPCKYTTSNELCHSYLNSIGGRWMGPSSMSIEEYEFVSDYTFIKCPIPGMITSQSRFAVLKKRGDVVTDRKFNNLPTFYGNCFGSRGTSLEIPSVMRSMPSFITTEVFTSARVRYYTCSLLPIRHSFLSMALVRALAPLLKKVKLACDNIIVALLVEIEEFTLQQYCRISRLHISMRDFDTRELFNYICCGRKIFFSKSYLPLWFPTAMGTTLPIVYFKSILDNILNGNCKIELAQLFPFLFILSDTAKRAISLTFQIPLFPRPILVIGDILSITTNNPHSNIL